MTKCIVNQLLDHNVGMQWLQECWPDNAVHMMKGFLDAAGKIDLSKINLSKGASQKTVAAAGVGSGEPEPTLATVYALLKKQTEDNQKLQARVNQISSMYQDNSSDWTDDGDWYGEDDGQLATVGGFSSGQSVSTNSVGSQQSCFQSGQSTGSSGSSQTHRAHSAMTALPPIRQQSAGLFIPGQQAQQSLMTSNDMAELQRYRQMQKTQMGDMSSPGFRARGANPRGRGQTGRGNFGGRGNGP